MPVRSLSRCAAISGTATLLFFFVSAGPVRPWFQDGRAPTQRADPAGQGQPPQSDTFEALPYPPDLAPNARTAPELAGCIEVRAWADKTDFKQLEPVAIHYEYKLASKQIVKISGIPKGMHSLDVDVASGADLMPRTRYGSLPRTLRVALVGHDGRNEITLDPRYQRGGSRRTNPGQFPATFEEAPLDQGIIIVNLLRDMTNPGWYEINVVLPVYNSDFTAKARPRSPTVRVRVLPPARELIRKPGRHPGEGHSFTRPSEATEDPPHLARHNRR